MTAFSTIVVDPPWPYNDRVNAKNRGAGNHYALMTLTDLRALPLADVAAPDSHLYVWTTNSFIAEAFVLMTAWGWTQKTVLTWVKPQIGMGHFFRNNTEHVVFGVRGRLPALRKNVPTAFTAPRTQHSAKPDAFYDIVESMSPPPYLDVFARERRPGWKTVGNAIDGQDVNASLRKYLAIDVRRRA